MRTGVHRQTDRLTVATKAEGGKAEVPTGSVLPSSLQLDRPGSSGQAIGPGLQGPAAPMKLIAPASVLGDGCCFLTGAYPCPPLQVPILKLP